MQVPPMIGVLVVGIVAIVLTGSFSPGTNCIIHLFSELHRPEFSLAAMVELVVPLR